MTIGILTFHWAANYGAVLQAYALQIFLTKLGHDVQIIDYMPRSYGKSFVKCFMTKRPWVIKRNLLEYFKEKSFVAFRKKNFKLTSRYNSLQEMKKDPHNFDVYICGSDQIWNPFFLKHGERQTTTSYFLDFGNETTIRIAYAVSFGCAEYAEEIRCIAAPLLSKFNAISVREESGCEIIHSMGFDKPVLMPDPTLLLSAKDYDELLECPASQHSAFSFFYIIHDHQFIIKNIEDYFRDKLSESTISTKQFRYSMIDIKEWLCLIKNSKCIITNSFHGIVLSIIYKKQFIAVPVEGSLASMNDRIFTLLNQFNLQDRILNNCEPSRIAALLSEQVKWNYVEEKIQTLRKDAEFFLSDAIKQKKAIFEF